MNGRIVVWLHIAALCLLGLQYALYNYLQLTFRGTSSNLLPVSLVFFSGMLLFFSMRNKVPLAGKIYLWLYALLAPLYVLWMIMLLPQQTYISNNNYSIHGHVGLLNAPGGLLYRNDFIFKKFVGDVHGFDPIEIKQMSNLKVIGNAGQESAIVLQINGVDSVFSIDAQDQ